ncbi:MAG: galactokinase [Saprospiraceae bacterium]|nr:galactokinase [Saprospiraceae bacterium]
MTGSPLPPLARKVRRAYLNRFDSEPEIIIMAPGRINLIGEHTDYNLGYVLPGAVQYGVCFALGPNVQNRHTWIAMDKRQEVVLSGAGVTQQRGDWTDYLLGAWLAIGRQLPNPPLVNAVFSADLPEGAGLSSSSALTCGMLFGLQQMLGLSLERADIAWMAHQVEREFVGLQGGIMDQHACMLGKAGHLLLLDCRDRSFEQIPFATEDMTLFLINTNVKHNLTETDYNTRADECRQAVEIIAQHHPVESLRDVDEQQVDQLSETLGPVLTRRVRFVLAENRRVLQTIAFLGQQNWEAIGRLLQESHDGLQTQYEVSCPELDSLAQLTNAQSWIHGARMMGGGFGGCVLCLAQRPPDEAFQEQVISAYRERFGLAPTFIQVRLADGARVVVR